MDRPGDDRHPGRQPRSVPALHPGLPAGRHRVRSELDLHDLERRAVTVGDQVRTGGRADRLSRAVRSVLDQAVLAKIRAGRLRDVSWPYGLRAVVAVGSTLFVFTGLLALLSGPIRGWSSLTVPNSLTSSVPDDVVWLLVFLLAFCLALFTTAASHGPWWLAT